MHINGSSSISSATVENKVMALNNYPVCWVLQSQSPSSAMAGGFRKSNDSCLLILTQTSIGSCVYVGDVRHSLQSRLKNATSKGGRTDVIRLTLRSGTGE